MTTFAQNIRNIRPYQHLLDEAAWGRLKRHDRGCSGYVLLTHIVEFVEFKNKQQGAHLDIECDRCGGVVFSSFMSMFTAHRYRESNHG